MRTPDKTSSFSDLFKNSASCDFLNFGAMAGTNVTAAMGGGACALILALSLSLPGAILALKQDSNLECHAWAMEASRVNDNHRS